MRRLIINVEHAFRYVFRSVVSSSVGCITLKSLVMVSPLGMRLRCMHCSRNVMWCLTLIICIVITCCILILSSTVWLSTSGVGVWCEGGGAACSSLLEGVTSSTTIVEHDDAAVSDGGCSGGLGSDGGGLPFLSLLAWWILGVEVAVGAGLGSSSGDLVEVEQPAAPSVPVSWGCRCSRCRMLMGGVTSTELQATK